MRDFHKKVPKYYRKYLFLLRSVWYCFFTYHRNLGWPVGFLQEPPAFFSV